MNFGATSHALDITSSREFGIVSDFDEKIVEIPDELREGKESVFVPMKVAADRVRQISDELRDAKRRHLKIIDRITLNYEQLAGENRDQFQEVLDRVKSRAMDAINQHKNLISQLQQDKRQLQELVDAQDQGSDIATKTIKLQAEQDKVEVHTLLTAKASGLQILFDNAPAFICSRG